MASDMSWDQIKNLTVLPPPPGVTPDFAHPTSRAYELRAAAGIGIPIIVFFAALHLVMEAVYGPFIWFVKLSLFVLYVQIFRPLRWLRFLAWAGAVLTGLMYFATSIAFAVLCAPSGGHHASIYLLAYSSPKCRRATDPLVTIIGILSLVSDIYLVVLPLPAVWNLQLPFRRKLGVSAMFLTGIGACIASALALSQRLEILRTRDSNWIGVPIGIATIVEFTTGIIVCCMPTTRLVFKHWQSLASTKISVYKKSRSSYHPDRSTACEMGSVPKDRPSLRDRSYDSSTRLTDEIQASQSKKGSQTSDWLSEYEKRSTFFLDDSQIRKTTDITITR
ncbi:MAG: hypothetical protein Q9222_003738 [Ikaeria aurantiellina]